MSSKALYEKLISVRRQKKQPGTTPTRAWMKYFLSNLIQLHPLWPCDSNLNTVNITFLVSTIPKHSAKNTKRPNNRKFFKAICTSTAKKSKGGSNFFRGAETRPPRYRCIGMCVESTYCFLSAGGLPRFLKVNWLVAGGWRETGQQVSACHVHVPPGSNSGF